MHSELDAAKEKALAGAEESVAAEETIEETIEKVEEKVEEEVVEKVEEEVEETEEDELQAHKDRSNLGRKFKAAEARYDKIEKTLETVTEVLARVIPKEEEDETLDQPVTRGELQNLLNQQKEDTDEYSNEFRSTFSLLAEKNELTEQEVIDIFDISFDKYNDRLTGNGPVDAALSFEKAKNDYFGAKKSVLRKNTPPKVIIKQKTKKEPTLKKLDSNTASLLKFIEESRGKEAATKLHKSL